MGTKPRPRLQRFLDKISPCPVTGCWLWAASTSRDGYGHFFDPDSREQRAHRVSWVIHRGPIPLGRLVLHRCDEPTCVNPEHLYLGTQGDNIADKMTKGRHLAPGPLRPARGSDNAATKLSVNDVLSIRTRHTRGHSGPVREPNSTCGLAREYGVSPRTIDFIVKRVHWRHILKG